MFSLCDVVAGVADNVIARQLSQPDLQLLRLNMTTSDSILSDTCRLCKQRIPTLLLRTTGKFPLKFAR